MPAIKVNVKLPDPLQELWIELREIDEMTYYSTKTENRSSNVEKSS